MDQKKIGKFISILRKKKQLTQEELAEKLGVSNKTISRWENGNNLPDLSLLSLLSEELDVNINDLLTGEVVDDEDYQEVLERNIINVVKSVDDKNKSFHFRKYMLITILFIFILLLGWFWFYTKYLFIEEFDKSKMSVSISYDEVTMVYKNSCAIYDGGTIEHIITAIKEDDKEIGIIFVTSKCSLSAKREYENIYLNRTNLIHSNSYAYDDLGKIDVDFPEKFRVYYTTIDFNDIRLADKNKLNNIIKSSNLIYENK